MCCFTSEAGWVTVPSAGCDRVRVAVAVGAEVTTFAIGAALEPGSATLNAAVACERPWLCWMKAKESGVSCLRAGRLLCTNTGESSID